MEEFLRNSTNRSRGKVAHRRTVDTLFYAMKVQCFSDTDTLYIEFRAAAVSETRDLDENTLLDIDAQGQICGLTVEHAKERADLPKFSYEQAA
jgi:uncharacterized protein YuzE